MNSVLSIQSIKSSLQAIKTCHFIINYSKYNVKYKCVLCAVCENKAQNIKNFQNNKNIINISMIVPLKIV